MLGPYIFLSKMSRYFKEILAIRTQVHRTADPEQKISNHHLLRNDIQYRPGIVTISINSTLNF